ncbi:MAG TPA: hypothetical protein VMX94_10470 [Armatimonadota bacterium]|nr:hypothetical protein [Armatimonadota bacterium]
MDRVPGAYMRMGEPPLPAETTVETALNSRCSSDHDGNPRAGHWGMCDADTPVPLEYLHALDRAVQVPRFTHHRLSVNFDERPIIFSISNAAAGIERQWLHVESGMQHQAVHLVSAALGMGTCIYNLGVDGKYVNEELWATARMGIEMMLPSFDGSLWSAKAPDDWVSDSSLPDPRRDGGVPLLQAMEDLVTSVPGRKAEWQDVSQLLWAARGRTPHLYGGKRWGLTIPTWAGIQDIACLYLASKDGIFRYVNWRNDRPTHALEQIGGPLGRFEPDEHQMIVAADEQSCRALWEVGYMVENALVQTVSLGVRCEAALLEPEVAGKYEQAGISGAAAVLTLYRK